MESVKILVVESNLLWSSKLKSGLTALGHEPVVSSGFPVDPGEAAIAIVNLSQLKPSPADLIRWCHENDIKVIAHAGHKEKELHALGREAGADVLATNGELSSKLADVLARAGK